ncbi:serine hydrolase [Kitasatospora herbaricolor]|uniref:serine hydrolase domain-containing protein n=1 Tax=Kitasatospora herbaricolor TaxID=68217 RepID=UPI001749BA64|nr:serine hydrolase domain-containing protein [Kitasatospora herbaricolor]MDQ0306974.1 D-alanyl-D-alanine carboxypeptidase [Kitasatospora herbaricolor]GGV18977.1 serine hydrolase [Kitasatospora herbaricolor]
MTVHQFLASAGRTGLRLATGMLAGALLAATAPTAGAATAAGVAPGPAAARADEAALRQALADIVAAGGSTAALAEVHDGGRTVWRGTAGTADLATHAPVRADGHFRIGSITKTFVATVVLQLVGEGRLRLDDTVEHLLPGAVPGGTGITLRQLLDHTSGIPDYTEDPRFEMKDEADILRWVDTGRWTTYRPRELVDVATAHPALFPPGTGWSYSNTNYLLAGMAVERVTGHSWEEEVRRRIVLPLGLTGTSFPRTSPFVPAPHAHGYFSLSGGPVDVTLRNPSGASAAGSGISTAADLDRFLAALLGGRLLRPAELAEMQRTTEVRPGVGYGLGLQRMDSPCGPLFGHTGSIEGYQSALVGTRDGGRQIALSYNPFDRSKGAEQQRAVLGLLVNALCPSAPTGGATPNG